MNICFFVCGFSSHSRIFHSCGDVTFPVKGYKFWTYTQHSWPLSSEGSLTNHTYCDTSQPFIMVIPEDPWHSYLLPSLWKVLKNSRPGIEPWPLACKTNAPPLHHRRGLNEYRTFISYCAFWHLSDYCNLTAQPENIPKFTCMHVDNNLIWRYNFRIFQGKNLELRI